MSLQPADYRNNATRHSITTGIDRDISNATNRGQFILKVDITHWPEYVKTEVVTELNDKKYHTKIDVKQDEKRGEIKTLVISWE